MSTLIYYLSSIRKIILQIENWPIFIQLMVASRFAIVKLRNGLRFKVRSAMDIWIIKETCLDHDYEQKGIAIQNDWVVIDIGAGLGDFSVSVAKQHPHCRVLAFEPFPQSYQLLQENINLNSVHNVESWELAITSDGRDVNLLQIGEAVQHTTSSQATAASSPSSSVKSMALLNVLALCGTKGCDLLKIDCEGGEYDILLNTSPAVIRQIQNFSIEFHEGVTSFSRTQLVNLFVELSYRVTVVPNPVHQNLGFIYASKIN